MMNRRLYLLSTILPGCSGVNFDIHSKNYKYYDNGDYLSNPGMGLIVYYYANSLKYYKQDIDKYTKDEIYGMSGVSVIYLRISWSYIEPEEGVFNWKILDEPINKFVRLGLKFAIRITCSENQHDQPYATPKWVYDAGAKYNRFDAGYPGKLNKIDGSNYEPDFNDDIFIEKLNNFLLRLSEKYDGNKNMAFIDIGSFGIYGEGHTVSSTQIEYDSSVLIRHINLYKNNFKKSKIIANHNFADIHPSRGRDFDVLKYCADLNMGFRDDSILISPGNRAYYDEKLSKMFHYKSPVILETSEYSTRVKNKLWNNQKVIDAIIAYKASYFGIYWWPLKFYNEKIDLIKSINKIIGYRINVIELNIVGDIDKNSFYLSGKLANVGVAPIYENTSFIVFCEDAEKNKFLIGESKENNLIGITKGDSLIPPVVDFKIKCAIPLFLKNKKIRIIFSIYLEDSKSFINFPHKENIKDNGILVDAFDI